MKLVKTLLIIGLLLAFVGCTTEEKITENGDLVTFSEGGDVDVGKVCILAATARTNGYFHMVSTLFENEIPCETDTDCYEFLLGDEDYRGLAPEFEAYLDCEERDDTISPNKMRQPSDNIIQIEDEEIKPKRD